MTIRGGGDPSQKMVIEVFVRMGPPPPGMDDEIDKIHPEDEGDGLPNIRWRLRIIVAAMLGGAAAWAEF
jgi:hypothetical protein